MKKSTWIVVGIFALLLAVFLLYPQIAPSKEEPVERPPHHTYYRAWMTRL